MVLQVVSTFFELGWKGLDSFFGVLDFHGEQLGYEVAVVYQKVEDFFLAGDLLVLETGLGVQFVVVKRCWILL